VSASPNIVFILVDNVGWGNFGVYGGTIPTPRIDRFARVLLQTSLLTEFRYD
jgi:arylsulfatase A-like enzyme